MAGHYALKTFLRTAPNELIRYYLDRQGIGRELPWDHLGEMDIGRICEAIDNAPEPVRRQIDWDFRQIHDMADPGGIKTLIEEARDPHHGLDIAEDVGRMSGHSERAFWAFLTHPEVFNVARKFHYADNLSWWRKRHRLPPAVAATDGESQHRLAADISHYYVAREGRGHACELDHYKRGEALYWFAYPEDYAETRLLYDEKRRLEPRMQRPAFEVIYVYKPDEHSLELFVRGDKRTVYELQKVFGRAILGVELLEERKDSVTYELNGLLDRNFAFVLEPGDGIESVEVRALRLEIMGTSRKRITLETVGSGEPQAVYNLLDDILAGNRIPRDLLIITQAKFRLVFHADATGRKGTLTFTVGCPNSCTLRQGPRDDLGRECLKRWGIDVSGRSSADPPESGLPAQYCIHN
jgi:hypothetical protein